MGGQAGLNPRVRQAQIAELIHKRGNVTVGALAEHFSASHETIRRDLTRLDVDGRIRKVHGGATLPRLPEEGPFRERLTTNEPAKRAIAVKVTRLVDPGETILIDTGSTTLFCAQELSRIDRLTVITNSTAVAAAISEGGRAAGIYLAGGAYDGDNRETVGPMAIGQLRFFHSDHAIIGAAALDAARGVMDANGEEAMIGQTMVDLADNVIVVADATKFDRRATFAVCGFDRVGDLVCDRPPRGRLAEVLAEADVGVQ